MVVVEKTDKIRANNRIVGYRLRDKDGGVFDIKLPLLEQWVSEGLVKVINMKQLGSGKLVDWDVDTSVSLDGSLSPFACINSWGDKDVAYTKDERFALCEAFFKELKAMTTHRTDYCGWFWNPNAEEDDSFAFTIIFGNNDPDYEKNGSTRLGQIYLGEYGFRINTENGQQWSYGYQELQDDKDIKRLAKFFIEYGKRTGLITG